MSSPSLVCSITNEVAEEPVVSPASGRVFERRIIQKHLDISETDPINGAALRADQLITLDLGGASAGSTSSMVRARAPNATSIPALLKTLQEEWDATMYASFLQRQQMQTLRQELSHSLYQHDAACRVIARLNKEVAAAREALATLKPQQQPGSAHSQHHHHLQQQNQTSDEAGMMTPSATPNYQSGGAGDATPSSNNKANPAQEVVPVLQLQEEVGLSAEIFSTLEAKAKTLTAERKALGKALPPTGLATTDQLRDGALRLANSFTGLHQSSAPAILCMDVQRRSRIGSNDDSRSPKDCNIVTGGLDKRAVVFNASSGKVIAQLGSHTKKVTRVIYHPTVSQQSSGDVVLTGCADSLIRIFNTSMRSSGGDGVGSGVVVSANTTIRAHRGGPISGLSLHATGDYVLSCCSGAIDGQWAFSDIRQGQLIIRAGATAPAGGGSGGDSRMTCAEMHPDGLILACGTDQGEVQIWDLERKKLASFKHCAPGVASPVNCVSFSENGYFLASGGDNQEVKLWDLRKLRNFKTLYMTTGPDDDDERTSRSGGVVNALRFDDSGNYLGVAAGSGVRIFQCSRSWDQLSRMDLHADVCSGVAFGHLAHHVISCGHDRSVKIYASEAVPSPSSDVAGGGAGDDETEMEQEMATD